MGLNADTFMAPGTVHTLLAEPRRREATRNFKM